jgi:hypothetical protein
MSYASSPEITVCCLKCGASRKSQVSETGHLAASECLWCGYAGWREDHLSSPTAELTPVG